MRSLPLHTVPCLIFPVTSVNPSPTPPQDRSCFPRRRGVRCRRGNTKQAMNTPPRAGWRKNRTGKTGARSRESRRRLRSGHRGHDLAGAPCPGTAEGDVKFLEGARRGPGEPLQRQEARGEARVAPSAGRGRRRPGGAQPRRPVGSCGLGAKQRTVRKPSRPAQASPPDRSPRRARGSRGAATRPPATHQDAFEEVALLGRQLHVRHRGRRGGWVARLSVRREWATRRDAARSRGRAMGQFIGLELGLGSLGRAGGGKGTRSKPDTLSSHPAPGRAAAGPRAARWRPGPAPSRGRCARARGAPRRGAAESWGAGGRPGRPVLLGTVAFVATTSAPGGAHAP